MKKILAIALLLSFTAAVCHAVPQVAKTEIHKTETGKKSFELPAFDMPVSFEVSPAPSVFYDAIVLIKKQSFKIVSPLSNSPPKAEKTPLSYSMAYWRS